MIRSRSKLGHVVAGLGLGIGLIVAIAGPAGYLAVAYSELSHELSLLAELKATRLAKYIYAHQELWQYQTIRLAELIDIPEAREAGARQRIFDPAGALVLETGEAPAFPVATSSAPVVVAGARVATIETATSYRDILVETAIVAVFSSLLGLAVFFVIRILPLRIIDRTLDELEVAQARYRLLFDANPFPMVVVHRQSGAFLAVNAAAVERYGWSRGEILAMKVGDLRPPGEAPRPRAIGPANKPATGAATPVARRHRRKDGTVIEVEVTTRAIEFEGQPAALSLAVDVTERNRIEEQLRQSQKMEAVGQLTGGIAHDFNNLLTVIIANLEALEEDDRLGPAGKAHLESIGGAADRAAELTRQLLAFSRKQPLRAQVTALNELVAGTVKLLRRSLSARIEIDTVLAAGLWAVDVDRAQLETALVNLCLNARDAMPGGGKLMIETRNATLDEDYAARNSDVVAGDYAMLAVTDTGTGMPPEVLARIYDPFFTTKEVGKGTGLGLSMVYGFIMQSNGHMKVYSEPGRGTTFKLFLPRTAQASDRATPAEKPAMPRGDERVLVVEDEPAVRATLVGQLASLGYDVAQAADGAAGLAAFEAAPRPYDLLLTDVLMPGMDGKALAAIVAERWPATRIVFMSGYAESAVVHHGTIDAGVLLLSKPFRKSELARMIRQALDVA
ncbi:ATP-binding protein [Reyranella sp.]|uniref:ATP-binding protein n=1 Tax=Reyranella sp. TaxID=1929291 RepID=UPI0027307219|nr:ATP-binding protein [Reyranella sp.]MDP2372169.1 response regulator [Reyranella sp.]